mmetsp:Transcript_29385/g.48855  ORF Transcript_29385/g.48855 Transcript_29385/m.48855 type:complete len:133 (-) Transcript_29385:1388-1786(-)
MQHFDLCSYPYCVILLLLTQIWFAQPHHAKRYHRAACVLRDCLFVGGGRQESVDCLIAYGVQWEFLPTNSFDDDCYLSLGTWEDEVFQTAWTTEKNCHQMDQKDSLLHANGIVDVVVGCFLMAWWASESCGD